jgi:hypothetical protein
MRVLLMLMPLTALAADSTAPSTPTPPPPYVVRVLALGHEPERRFFLRADGFFDMHELDPRELPPTALFLRSSSALAVPGARQPERTRLSVVLNSVTETQLPAPADGQTLVVERAVVVPAAEGKPAETRYEAVGEVSRAPGAGSALVVLYNPLGRRTWEGVKPSVIDTSSSRIPAGSMLLMNLCTEAVDASVGGRVGQLAGGQSALLSVAVPGGAPLELRLALRRGAEPTQLFDSAREMPTSRRALLIVHPVSPARNARGADFLLLPLSADPEPPPAPASAGAGR